MAPRKVTLPAGVAWRDRIWITNERGQKERKQVSAPTKRELDDLIERLQDQSRKHKLGVPDTAPPKTASFNELCELMLERWTQREESKISTAAQLRSSREAFGDWEVRDIGHEDVEAWFATLRKLDGRRSLRSPRKNYLKAMSQVLNYGVQRGYLDRNPAAGMKLPPGHQGADSADPFESWEEVERVAKALGRLYEFGGPLVLFVCATGLRYEEWSALEWHHFDLSVPLVRVVQTNVKQVIRPQGKTASSLAPVLMQDVAVEAIRSMNPLGRKGLVFPAPDGGVWHDRVFRQEFWKPALAFAGVRYRPPKHMRHTYATLALAATLPLEFVSRQLRHTTLEMTRKHYARWLRRTETHWLSVANSFTAAGLDGTNRPPVSANAL